MDQKYTTLAYPATVCMDCQADEITDDEASVETPEVTHKETNKGTRPVTLDVEQMREEIFIDKDQETILQDEDTIVEEDFFTLTRFTGIYALALETESPYTYHHVQDGKAKHVTKENNKDPNKHGETTHQTTNVQ
jgi:hypothetical protein